MLKDKRFDILFAVLLMLSVTAFAYSETPLLSEASEVFVEETASDSISLISEVSVKEIASIALKLVSEAAIEENASDTILFSEVPEVSETMEISTDNIASDSLEITEIVTVEEESNKEFDANIEIADNASNTVVVEAESKKPGIYLEPFSETYLALLKERLVSLKEMYVYNHHSSELALAINVVLNNDGFIRRSCFRVIESGRQTPFSSAATLAIFPELLAPAEKVRVNIVKKAADKLVSNIYNDEKIVKDVIAQLRNDFALIDEICEDFHLIVKYNRQNEAEVAAIAAETFISDCPADYIKRSDKEIYASLKYQNDRFESFVNQYIHHKELCESRLNYIFKASKNISPVKQAVCLSEVLKSSNDFLKVFDNYQTSFSAFSNRMYDFINLKREGLENLVDGFTLKKIQVNDYLYRYPAKDRIYEIKKQTVEPEALASHIFNNLNKLCESELLSDILMSPEDREFAYAQRLERSEKLFKEVRPLLLSIDWPIPPVIPEAIFEEPQEDTDIEGFLDAHADDEMEQAPEQMLEEALEESPAQPLEQMLEEE